MICDVSCCDPTVAAQATKTTWDGVYSQAQATRGAATYSKTCAGCHGAELMGADTAPSLTGPDFNSGWNDLYERLTEEIALPEPPGSPSPRDANASLGRG